jgi:hypothetical protein
MVDGRKPVLGIMASIPVAHHLKDDRKFAPQPSKSAESLVASAVQWAERSGEGIDGAHRKLSR